MCSMIKTSSYLHRWALWLHVAPGYTEASRFGLFLNLWITVHLSTSAMFPVSMWQMMSVLMKVMCKEAAGGRRRPAGGRRRPAVGHSALAVPPGDRNKAKLMTTHSELQLMIRFLGRLHSTAAIATNFSGCLRFVCMPHRFCASLQLYTKWLQKVNFQQNLVGFQIKLTAIFCYFSLFFFRLCDWNACQFCPAAMLLLLETSIWQSIELWVQRSNTQQDTIKAFHCFTKVLIPSRRGWFYLATLYFTHRLAIAVPHGVQCDLILASAEHCCETQVLYLTWYKSVSDYLRQNCSLTSGAVRRGRFTTTNRPFCFVVP